MSPIYLSSARSLLRRVGVIRLLTIPLRLKIRRRYRQYQRTRPASVDATVASYSASMLISDAVEYARVLSFRDDRHIIQALIDHVKPGDDYWDVGSSIGLYSVLLGKRVGPSGKVIAIEPEPRSYRRLVENVGVNGLNNVRTYNVGLGRRREQAALRVSSDASSGTHTFAYGPQADDLRPRGTSAVVEIVPGDELRADESLSVPTALKIDVEGAEEGVIVGLADTLHHPLCHTLVCEVHFSILESIGDGRAPARIVEYISQCGFRTIDWLDHSHFIARK